MPLHVGDYGGSAGIGVTVMEFGAPKNISTATGVSFTLVRPDGVVFNKTASMVSDGSDGLVTYTVENGLLTMAGPWKIQVVITFAAGLRHTEIKTFSVEANL